MPRSDIERQRAALRRRLAVSIAAIGVAALVTLGAVVAAVPEEARNGGIISAAVFAIAVGLGAAWLAVDVLFVRPLSALTAEIRFLSEAARDADIEPGRYPGFAPLPQLVNALTRRVATARTDTERSVAAATRRVDEQKGLLEGILRDLSEGVVVCSLDHRILLYNQVALSLLAVSGELGLGRSLFNLVTREPVLHTLDRLIHREPADSNGEPTAPLVCATVDARALLRGRMMLIADGGGEPTGYILTLADVTRDIAQRNRRDRLLRAATDGLRSPLANLRAAAETLGEFPDIDAAKRREFEQIIVRESEALGLKLEAIERDNRELSTGLWPLADIHSVDLLNCVIRRLADSGGPVVTMVGVPLWLHGDSHSLVIALDQLLRNLAAHTGETSFDIEALLGDRRVYVEIAWAGEPIAEATLNAWLGEPLPEALGAPGLAEVLARHGSEIWSRQASGPGAAGAGRAVLRLPLPAPTRIQFRLPENGPLPARPQFYDFDLMHLAPTDRGLEGRGLRSVPYVVFDTETTGLNPSQGDEIIAIGAVRVVNGRILTGETFSRLIDPGRTIPPDSIRFHNITDAMVAGAPPLSVALPQFRAFVGDAVLVAHNTAFDLKFIRLKEADGGPRFAMLALDTMLISMFLYPDFGEHDLDSIARRLGVEVSGRHSALGDALVTAAVFLRLVDLLEARGITTLGDLIRASNMTLDIRLRQEQF